MAGKLRIWAQDKSNDLYRDMVLFVKVSAKLH